MPYRPEKHESSTGLVNIRLTPEELEEWAALCRYLNETRVGMLRRLVKEERARLVAAGKKPPRKLPAKKEEP